MSKRRVRIRLTPRDPADAPENVDFTLFCLQQGIDIVASKPEPVRVDINTTEDDEETKSRPIKDEALETDARQDVQVSLEQVNAALDRSEAKHKTDDSPPPLPEPKVVASRMKGARAWVAGLCAAGWSVTVKAAVTAVLEHYDKKG